MRRPDLVVSSAGLGALVGNPAHPVAREVAAEKGIALEGHVARQFVTSLAIEQDLILAMEPAHRREIGAIVPQVTGRTLLFDQWTGAKGIVDPYRRSRELHEIVFRLISAAAEEWAKRI